MYLTSTVQRCTESFWKFKWPLGARKVPQVLFAPHIRTPCLIINAMDDPLTVPTPPGRFGRRLVATLWNERRCELSSLSKAWQIGATSHSLVDWIWLVNLFLGKQTGKLTGNTSTIWFLTLVPVRNAFGKMPGRCAMPVSFESRNFLWFWDRDFETVCSKFRAYEWCPMNSNDLWFKISDFWGVFCKIHSWSVLFVHKIRKPTTAQHFRSRRYG